jgi:hypothetical protein
MALGALTLRRPARRDPEEEEANQAEGGLGGRTGGRSQRGTRRGAARRQKRMGPAAAWGAGRVREGRRLRCRSHEAGEVRKK